MRLIDADLISDGMTVDEIKSLPTAFYYDRVYKELDYQRKVAINRAKAGDPYAGSRHTAYHKSLSIVERGLKNVRTSRTS